jgi:hypothetical protein
MTPSSDDLFMEWWLQSRKLAARAQHLAFDSLILLVVWLILLERNGRVFHSVSHSPVALVQQVWDLVEVWPTAGKVVQSQLFGE